MKTMLIIGLLVFPCTAIAAEDCQVVEFPDHFEVTCTGDAKPVPISKQSLEAPQAPAPVPSQSQEPVNVPQHAETSQPPDAAKSSTPVSGPGYVKSPGRQGRPNAADMNAAIEARRRLIQQMQPQTPPAVP